MEEKVVEMTKAAIARSDSAMLWAVDIVSFLRRHHHHHPDPPFPSIALGHALVACAFDFPDHSRAFWTYLNHAMASNLVSSLHVLALLTSRVLPERHLYPEKYSMFLELTGTHIFCLRCTKAMPFHNMIVEATEEALQLSAFFKSKRLDFGTAVVQFIFILILRLVQAFSEDLSLPTATDNRMDEARENFGMPREDFPRSNSITAINLVTRIMQNKKTRALLRLARRNLPDEWNGFTQNLEMLEVHVENVSYNIPKETKEALHQLLGFVNQDMCDDWNLGKSPVVQVLVGTSSRSWSFGNNYNVGRAAAWLPIDIFMENMIDGQQVPATSVITTLAELVKSLQAALKASWHDAFLALWMSALRLVQRERDHMEGPKPQSGSRCCMLLSIVPLASVLLIEEEEKQLINMSSIDGTSGDKDKKAIGKRRAAFLSSLEVLGQFEGLLSPRHHVAKAAYPAAATQVGGFNGGTRVIEGIGTNEGNASVRTAPNLVQLIVETCIARGLVDSSAYFWPGYVGTVAGNSMLSGSSQTLPWDAYMNGAPLSTVKNSLINTPARSLAELDKVYQVAINGINDEKPIAASILCGASLVRGWSVQEHAVELVLRLLVPPPADSRGNNQFLISDAPMLHATLVAISTDVLHILSLYGMFPRLAAALLPICEFFGSLSPSIPIITGPGEEISVLTLFSLGFIILIQLWKFHRHPVEHRLLDGGHPLGSALSLEYLLTLYNIQISSLSGSSVGQKGKDDLDTIERMPTSSRSLLQPSCTQMAQVSNRIITLDAFPQLKGWYLQHRSCIACTLSGVAPSNPVHEVADRVLTMLMRRTSKSGNTPSSIMPSSSSGDDSGGKPLLPAWDLLAAVPFIVDAFLTAYSHGKLSSRDLTTGLKDLVDFLPASIVSIVSYLAAEVARGPWKPVPMNGKDWPTPSPHLLSSIEAEMRDMLIATGINVPKSVTETIPGNFHVTLPLPLAALVSLTITFKVDKNTETILNIAGSALQYAASGSSWPSMCVVAALWAQKVRRWHSYIVFGALESTFKLDKTTIVELLHSCFAITLGLSSSHSKLTVHGGVGALLGHSNWTHATPQGRLPVPPGILYLHMCSCLHDLMFLPWEILAVLLDSVQKLDVSRKELKHLAGCKNGPSLRSLFPSLATTVSKISQASALAAGLLFVSGGTTLVQLLYTETLPTWFLSGDKTKEKLVGGKSGHGALLEGYAVANLAVLAGLLVWGTSEAEERCLQRVHALGVHMEFLATALDGKVSLSCEPGTWKGYILSFVSLMLTSASTWVSDVQVDTLKRIARALRMWHEHDLAAALLESGGCLAMGAAAELTLSTF